MKRNFIYRLLITLILFLNCCEKDKTECSYITIFEEDFESCSTSECPGWTGYYKIITCDSTDICGNKVMELVAGWCPGVTPAEIYLTGLNETNIIRLTMNYKLNCCSSWIQLYYRENVYKWARINYIDTNWDETVLIDTISFNPIYALKSLYNCL
jgi:hypothetical protein